MAGGHNVGQYKNSSLIKEKEKLGLPQRKSEGCVDIDSKPELGSQEKCIGLRFDVVQMDVGFHPSQLSKTQNS
jgi:hypothetical protein